MYYIELIASRFFFQTDDFYFFLKKIKNVDLSAFFFILKIITKNQNGIEAYFI